MRGGVSAVLSGIAGCLPPKVLTNADMSLATGADDEWIYSRTGIRQRHVVEPGVSTADLAVEAGARALKSAGCDSVDAVLVATATPDYLMPATAPTVAARLSQGAVSAFDINAVCAGFVYGLAMGSALIGAGMAERVLLIGADVFSSVVPHDDPVIRPLFGDGAGAAVLRAGERDEHGALAAFDLGSDGDLADLIMIPGGGSRQRSGGQPPACSEMYFTMQGQRVFSAAVSHMASSSNAVLAQLGRSASAVDRMVGHQANARILLAVARQLGIPNERLVMNIDQVGNTSAASIPLAICDAIATGSIRPGDFTLLTAFGGGLAWGSTATVWPSLIAG
jgi:3-oxoacyl-[acyl-carrier-protein] synthase-3